VRLLFVTDQFPWPLNDGGNLRTWHILEGLCRDHDVTLLAHRPHGVIQKTARLPENLRSVVTIEKPSLHRRIIENTARMGVTRYPLFLLKNNSLRLQQRVEALLARESFDAVHFNHLDTACFVLMHDWPQLLIFDSHNCLSAMAVQVARESVNPLSRWLFQREAELLRAVEHRVCQRSSMCLVCSDNDAEQFRRICPEGHYRVAPNGANTDYFSFTSALAPDIDSIVFTGAMNYFPNEQAALFLCREILPLLRTYGRRIRILVVGKSPTAKVRALHTGNEVIVTGTVTDVRPFLERASVVAVPLKHGSGTRLKILEAFAMGKAVVSTRIGAEGINAIEGRDILYADNASQFAAQLMRVLDDDRLRQALGKSGQLLANTQYSWPNIQQRLRDAYQRLQARHQESSTAS